MLHPGVASHTWHKEGAVAFCCRSTGICLACLFRHMPTATEIAAHLNYSNTPNGCEEEEQATGACTGAWTIKVTRKSTLYDMRRGTAWPPARRASSATGWAAPPRRRCRASPSPSAPWVTREGPCPGIIGVFCCRAYQGMLFLHVRARSSYRHSVLAERQCACQGMPMLTSTLWLHHLAHRAAAGTCRPFVS